MTLAARNGVLYTGIAFTLILLIGFGAVAYWFFTSGVGDSRVDLPSEQIWFGRVLTVPDNSIYYSLGGAGAHGVLAVAGVAIATRLFRRVSSAEVYFFTLFLVMLSLELLRIGQLPLIATEQPPLYGSLLTRAILFGRLLGYLVLFSAGIYAAGAEYPRIGTVTLLLATLTFLVVYFMPVDLLRINATLVHRVGGRQSLDAVFVFLSVGTIANYAIAWGSGRSDRGLLVFGAVAVLVVGRELVFNIPAIVPSIIGVVFVAVGGLGFMMTTRSRYLWY